MFLRNVLLQFVAISLLKKLEQALKDHSINLPKQYSTQ